MTDLSFNPQTPPQLHVEPLPAGAILAAISSSVDDGYGNPLCKISAWLPDRWAINETIVRSGTSEDEFIDDHCSGCSYNCSSISLDSSDLDDRIWVDHEDNEWPIASARATSPCQFYEDGLRCVDWPCCAGHDEPDTSSRDEYENIELGAMRFTVERRIDQRLPFSQVDKAFSTVLQRAEFSDVEQRWYLTDYLRAVNTYEPSNAICWGSDNDTPSSLMEAAPAYASGGSNDDLLPVDSFIANIQHLRTKSTSDYVRGLPVDIPTDGGTYALLVASAAITPQAFLLLCASGAQQRDGFAVALAQWADGIALPNGQSFSGWISQPLAGNHCWLVQTKPNEWEGAEGLLLGQLSTDQIQFISEPCDSLEPSSSELAALAAC